MPMYNKLKKVVKYKKNVGYPHHPSHSSMWSEMCTLENTYQNMTSKFREHERIPHKYILVEQSLTFPLKLDHHHKPEYVKIKQKINMLHAV